MVPLTLILGVVLYCLPCGRTAEEFFSGVPDGRVVYQTPTGRAIERPLVSDGLTGKPDYLVQGGGLIPVN
jgi:hypothetical protein